MAVKITVTKKEEQSLRQGVEDAVLAGEHALVETVLSLLSKIDQAKVKVVEVATGPGLAEYEAALGGCRKYAAWLGGSPAQCLKTLGRHQASPVNLALIGRWVDGQAWLKSVSLDQIARNYTSWLALATHELGKKAHDSTLKAPLTPAGFED